MFFTPTVTLEPFLPDNETHVAELKRQRQLCGWGLSSIDTWRAQSRSGLKFIYWIHPLSPSTHPLPLLEPLNVHRQEPSRFGPPPPDLAFRPLGHIALNWEDDDGHEEMACKETGTVTLTTFFVLGSAQGRGIGGAAIAEVEKKAASPEVGARWITLGTWTAKNTTDATFWERIGRPQEPAAIGKMLHKEVWYGKKGYETFKTEAIYPYENHRTGEKFMLDIAAMRKELV